MVIEYVGGIPGRAGISPITAAVHNDTLRLKYGRLFGGWSFQVPLSAISSVELATLAEVQASGHLPATVADPRQSSPASFLAIAVPVRDEPARIILRGPWSLISELRQAILQGRMRAAKQWHA